MKGAGTAQTGSSGSIESTWRVARTPRPNTLLRMESASRLQDHETYLPSSAVARSPVRASTNEVDFGLTGSIVRNPIATSKTARAQAFVPRVQRDAELLLVEVGDVDWRCLGHEFRQSSHERVKKDTACSDDRHRRARASPTPGTSRPGRPERVRRYAGPTFRGPCRGLRRWVEQQTWRSIAVQPLPGPRRPRTRSPDRSPPHTDDVPQCTRCRLLNLVSGSPIAERLRITTHFEIGLPRGNQVVCRRKKAVPKHRDPFSVISSSGRNPTIDRSTTRCELQPEQ